MLADQTSRPLVADASVASRRGSRDAENRSVAATHRQLTGDSSARCRLGHAPPRLQLELDRDCLRLRGLHIKTFDCSIDAPPLTGQATIDTVGDTTCSGIIGAGDEMPRFWIDCETSTICVEHTDECFDATFSAQGFSYTIPGKSSTITCTAK